MDSDDGARVAGDIFGSRVSEVTDALVSRNAARDPSEVRGVLDTVAAAGTVTEDAVDDALTDAAMTLSTAETRTELTSIALSDARETAAPVSDFGAVRSRLAAFESVAESLERRTDALGSDLQALDSRPDAPEDLYDVATELRRITDDANDVHRAADEAQVELESFERWLTDAETRFEEHDGDAEALERAVDALEEAADGTTNADDEGDPAAVWADATLRHRVVGLLLTDARAELSDLREWAALDAPEEGVGVETDEEAFEARATDVEARFDELDDRLSTVGGRLADRRRPAWADRYGERVTALEEALEGFDHPVPWDEVRDVLDQYRPSTDEAR